MIGAALLAVLIGVLLPAAAYVTTTITVDGDMTDWTPVLASGGNALADGQGADDPDNPGTASRDLDTVASTWDSNNVYFYFRRTTTGNNSVAYIAYIDRDGDGRLQATDMVANFEFNGNSYVGSTLRWYRPVDPAGDSMGGNGDTPDGTEGNAVPGATITAAGAANGIEVEARVTWTSLQKPRDSALNFHFSCGRKAGLPGAIEDNTGRQTLRRVGMVLTPDRNYGTAQGTSVTYAHTIRNTGNATDTFTFTTASSQGWGVNALAADGITPIGSLTLGPNATSNLFIRVNVPPGTPTGTEDMSTLQAASTNDPQVVGQASDITFVGPLTVTPPRNGSMAAGGVIEYTHTVRNNTGSAGTILLTATSTSDWNVGIYDAGGSTLVNRLDLAAGEAADVLVKITVPAGATLGATDITTLRGEMSGDPSTFGQAIDRTSVAKAASISPNNNGISGPGATAQYVHTITNSWNDTRSIEVLAASSRGWPVTIFDADGITQITSVTVGPFGGSHDIIVRVAVPATAGSGTVDATAVRVRFGGVVLDSVTDTTTVGKLATYASAGYVDSASTFNPGATVYARGMGLNGIGSVRFRWIDPGGAIKYTSPSIAVDIKNMAGSSYDLTSTATLGTWSCVLLNAGSGAEITRVPFTVAGASWLTMTLDTTAISYGAMDPGTSSPIRTISVTVDASGPFNLSSTMTGGVATLGLSVAGNAMGLKPGGIRTFSDNYQATPPWSATPGPTTVNVQYTAILQ